YLSRRVGRVGHIGLYGRIVLRGDVAALSDIVHESEPLLPLLQRAVKAREDSVARAADQAVWRPDRKLVAAILFQLSTVIERPPVHARHCRGPYSLLNIGARYPGEDRRMPSTAVLPKNRVRDMNPVVRVERHVNIVQLILCSPDHFRQPL